MIFDDDRGPNTGGMGAFAPSPLVDAALEARIMREIVEPVIDGMAAEGDPFRGFLYRRPHADRTTVRRSSSSTSGSAIPKRRSSCRSSTSRSLPLLVGRQAQARSGQPSIRLAAIALSASCWRQRGYPDLGRVRAA